MRYHLTPKQAVRQILDHGHFVKNRILEALDRAELDMRSGFPDRNGEPLGVASSSTSDSTSQLALGPKDQIEYRRDRMIQKIFDALRMIEDIENDIVFLLGMTPEEAKKVVAEETRKTRQCENCDRIVAATREDRLITGRCKQCYDYYRRNNKEKPKEPEFVTSKRFGTIYPSVRANKQGVIGRA